VNMSIPKLYNFAQRDVNLVKDSPLAVDVSRLVNSFSHSGRGVLRRSGLVDNEKWKNR
jgi:hypothetical protein